MATETMTNKESQIYWDAIDLYIRKLLTDGAVRIVDTKENNSEVIVDFCFTDYDFENGISKKTFSQWCKDLDIDIAAEIFYFNDERFIETVDENGNTKGEFKKAKFYGRINEDNHLIIEITY